MMKAPLYQTEFPGFPTLDVELPVEFGDDSNGYHDPSPCFLAPTLGLVLWITHPDPAERPEELFADAKRFCLCEMAQTRQFGHQCGPVIIETDDWSAVLSAITGRRRFNPARPDRVLASDMIAIR